MRSLKKYAGFSAIELIVVVAVMAVVGLLGYTFYSNYQNKKAQSTDSSQATVKEDAPEITTTEGLDEASATIDQTDIESSSNTDLSELDKEMSDL